MAPKTSKPRLRRSVLFVPGGDPSKIARAQQTPADTIVLDLEDAIAPEKKAEARACVATAIREGGFDQAELAVRINPPGTPFFDDDLAAVVDAPTAAIMLPKAERSDEIAAIADRLEASTVLLLLVESPLGIADALSIAGATPRAEALCFGHADFSLQMGLANTDVTNPVVHHARSAVAIAAKARGLAPIDCVHIAVRDEESFRTDTALGLSIGYEGRLCIHPQQVEIANEIYTPSPAQLEYAHRVIDGWERARREGDGVCTIDGKMVDQPLVAQQQRVLARAARSAR